MRFIVPIFSGPVRINIRINPSSASKRHTSEPGIGVDDQQRRRKQEDYNKERPRHFRSNVYIYSYLLASSIGVPHSHHQNPISKAISLSICFKFHKITIASNTLTTWIDDRSLGFGWNETRKMTVITLNLCKSIPKSRSPNRRM